MTAAYQDYTPTTITALRRRFMGWEIDYHTSWGFYEGKHRCIHRINCWVEDDECGPHWAERAFAQSWSKEKAIARVFVAVRGTEFMEDGG